MCGEIWKVWHEEGGVDVVKIFYNKKTAVEYSKSLKCCEVVIASSKLGFILYCFGEKIVEVENEN